MTKRSNKREAKLVYKSQRKSLHAEQQQHSQKKASTTKKTRHKHRYAFNTDTFSIRGQRCSNTPARPSADYAQQITRCGWNR
ncbi:unnamed protein product [Gongylonema pulchrum]|uniref:Uncharacterized protein n=1 Tax=Gongylonema pulchrum TaxID=637853 RepID=A0A183E9H5_9BILA|nr:unnamed protein product [Gongylonema pulchrum]